MSVTMETEGVRVKLPRMEEMECLLPTDKMLGRNGPLFSTATQVTDLHILHPHRNYFGHNSAFRSQ